LTTPAPPPKTSIALRAPAPAPASSQQSRRVHAPGRAFRPANMASRSSLALRSFLIAPRPTRQAHPIRFGSIETAPRSCALETRLHRPSDAPARPVVRRPPARMCAVRVRRHERPVTTARPLGWYRGVPRSGQALTRSDEPEAASPARRRPDPSRVAGRSPPDGHQPRIRTRAHACRVHFDDHRPRLGARKNQDRAHATRPGMRGQSPGLPIAATRNAARRRALCLPLRRSPLHALGARARPEPKAAP
jgi:hypothetical protein